MSGVAALQQLLQRLDGDDNKYPSQSACSPGLPYSMQPRPFRMQSCPCLLVCIPGLSKKKETKPEKLFNCLVVLFLFWSFGRFGCFILVESFYSFLFFSSILFALHDR